MLPHDIVSICSVFRMDPMADIFAGRTVLKNRQRICYGSLPTMLAATFLFLLIRDAAAVAIPTSSPSTAVTIDPSLLAVSIEFFAFPGYTNVTSTSKCLQNLGDLRGSPVAVRIGGTTQSVFSLIAYLSSITSYIETELPTTHHYRTPSNILLPVPTMRLFHLPMGLRSSL